MSEQEIIKKIKRVINDGDAYFSIFSGCYDGYLTTDIAKDIISIFEYCELLSREEIKELEMAASKEKQS